MGAADELEGLALLEVDVGARPAASASGRGGCVQQIGRALFRDGVEGDEH
jgi:hypothetical protein